MQIILNSSGQRVDCAIACRVFLAMLCANKGLQNLISTFFWKTFIIQFRHPLARMMQNIYRKDVQ